MLAIEVNGSAVPLNSEGLLRNPEDWDESVARAIAAEDGLELNDCHWAAINFLRQYYHEYDIPPSPRIMIREASICPTGVCGAISPYPTVVRVTMAQ